MHSGAWGPAGRAGENGEWRGGDTVGASCAASRARDVTPTGEGRRVAQRAERMLGDTRQLLQTLPPDDLAAVERVLDHLQARPARSA